MDDIVSKVYDCSDGHISELAKMARNETAFPIWRATESHLNSNVVSLVSSITELMRLPISETSQRFVMINQHCQSIESMYYI